MSEERAKLDALICSVNKDGRVNRKTAASLWDFVTAAAVDSFNGDLPQKEAETRFDDFRYALTRLASKNKN